MQLTVLHYRLAVLSYFFNACSRKARLHLRLLVIKCLHGAAFSFFSFLCTLLCYASLPALLRLVPGCFPCSISGDQSQRFGLSLWLYNKAQQCPPSPPPPTCLSWSEAHSLKLQDVYTEIAKLVQKRVDEDEGRGIAEAMVLRDNIDRKLVKQTVMTSVYGVTFVGARQQIGNRLKERGWEDDRLVYKASCYGARVRLHHCCNLCLSGACCCCSYAAPRSLALWCCDRSCVEDRFALCSLL